MKLDDQPDLLSPFYGILKIQLSGQGKFYCRHTMASNHWKKFRRVFQWLEKPRGAMQLLSNDWKSDKVKGMKRILLLSLLALSVCAEEPRGEPVESLPPAPQILAAARAQLPAHPVVMSGTLKQRAPNGFVKKTLNVEMELDWSARPPRAKYIITDTKTEEFQTLEINWNGGRADYSFSQHGEKKAFDPHAEIANIGITWSDLSFSFLWSPDAKTLGTGQKLGKECFLISVPRPEGNSLQLWVEKKTGRMMGAEEYDAAGKRQKIIKVVSVKDFDGLWMVKDLDIIQPAQGGRTSLRVNHVEARP